MIVRSDLKVKLKFWRTQLVQAASAQLECKVKALDNWSTALFITEIWIGGEYTVEVEKLNDDNDSEYMSDLSHDDSGYDSGHADRSQQAFTLVVVWKHGTKLKSYFVKWRHWRHCQWNLLSSDLTSLPAFQNQVASALALCAMLQLYCLSAAAVVMIV